MDKSPGHSRMGTFIEILWDKRRLFPFHGIDRSKIKLLSRYLNWASSRQIINGKIKRFILLIANWKGWDSSNRFKLSLFIRDRVKRVVFLKKVKNKKSNHKDPKWITIMENSRAEKDRPEVDCIAKSK